MYAQPRSTWRSVLSILWTIAIAAFLFLAILDIVGLVLAPGVVVPGIQNLRSGDTVNVGVDDASGWAFQRASLSSSGVWLQQDGNPGGYLESTSLGTLGPNSVGYWSQPFEVSGSEPFAARIQLDVKVDLGSSTTSATLYVLVDNESAATLPDTIRSVAELTFTRTSDWARAGTFRTDERFRGPGTYYLRFLVATTTDGPGTATTVGLDNIRLHWTTNEGVILWLPLPLPFPLALTQDIPTFLAYYGSLVLVILVAVAYHAIRERKATVAAFAAPLESIGARLRNRSAWLTVGQVWMAQWFFTYAFIFVMIAVGITPTSPFQPTAGSAWSLLYGLAEASVYEEFAYRLVLMGVPMALGSLLLRAMEINRSGGTRRGTASPRRYLLGSFRYVLGGTVRKTSTKETLLAAWALLLASTALFGVAHQVGYGWWKVLPTVIGGLAFGYLFLRHGITAAILGHFMQDYLLSIYLLGVGGDALLILQDLVLMGVAIAGAGFFVWYLIYAGGHFRALVSRFIVRPPVRYARPMPPPGPTAVLPAATAPYAAWSSPPPSPPSTMPRDPTVVPREYVPTYRAPPYGYPPVRFQCPYCGWVEARYDAGGFTCMRCGKTA